MTVGELSEKLKEFDPKLPVWIFDFDSKSYRDIEELNLLSEHSENYDSPYYITVSRSDFKDDVKNAVIIDFLY